jgi:hypothetical protein
MKLTFVKVLFTYCFKQFLKVSLTVSLMKLNETE